MLRAGTIAPAPTVTPGADHGYAPLILLGHQLGGASPDTGTAPDHGVFRHDGIAHVRTLLNDCARHQNAEYSTFGVLRDLERPTNRTDSEIRLPGDLAALAQTIEYAAPVAPFAVM